MTVDVIQSMSDLRQTGSPHEYVVAVVEVVEVVVMVMWLQDPNRVWVNRLMAPVAMESWCLASSSLRLDEGAVECSRVIEYDC